MVNEPHQSLSQIHKGIPYSFSYASGFGLSIARQPGVSSAVMATQMITADPSREQNLSRQASSPVCAGAEHLTHRPMSMDHPAHCVTDLQCRAMSRLCCHVLPLRVLCRAGSPARMSTCNGNVVQPSRYCDKWHVSALTLSNERSCGRAATTTPGSEVADM